METIPEEIKIRFLENMSPEQLSVISKINREYKRLSYDDTLWQKLVNDQFGSVPKYCDSWSQTYQIAKKYSKIYNVLFLNVETGNNFGSLGLFFNPSGNQIDIPYKDISFEIALFLSDNGKVSNLVSDSLEDYLRRNSDNDNNESNTIEYVRTFNLLPNHKNTNIYLELLNQAIMKEISNDVFQLDDEFQWDEGEFVIKIQVQSIIY